MSDTIAYVTYPLENIIKCELCREEEKGIFRAASRKDNYVRHLRRKHDIPTENIKVKCSACGRISEKGRFEAWRDTRTHYRNEHAQLLLDMQEGIVNKTVEQPLLPDKSNIVENVPSFSRSVLQVSQEADKNNVEISIPTQQSRKTVNVDGVIDLSSKTHGTTQQMVIVKSQSSLPPAPTVQFDNPVLVNNPELIFISDMPAVENLAMKKEKESCNSTSKIVAAMGYIFDVVATAAADSQAPTTSTPEKQLSIINDNCTTTTAAAAKQTENYLPHVSRIMPRARPALQRSWKRRLTSPTPVSPSKKLQRCLED